MQDSLSITSEGWRTTGQVGSLGRSIKPLPGFAVQRGLRRRVLRGLRRDHGSLINIGFAFNPLNLLPMLIFTVVIAAL
jgi:hypothetical protein